MPVGSTHFSPFQDRTDELKDNRGFQVVQMERETFYSPPEQQVTTASGISYIYPKKKKSMFVCCPRIHFPFAVLFPPPQVSFLPLESSCKLFIFSTQASFSTNTSKFR